MGQACSDGCISVSHSLELLADGIGGDAEVGGPRLVDAVAVAILEVRAGPLVRLQCQKT